MPLFILADSTLESETKKKIMIFFIEFELAFKHLSQISHKENSTHIIRFSGGAGPCVFFYHAVYEGGHFLCSLTWLD